MAPGQLAQSAYRKAEVETLSRRDLLVKLFQATERFLNTAMAAMANNKPDVAHENCQKARRIFIELLSTLNFDIEGGHADRLRDLYLFFIGEIVEANLQGDRERIAKILPVIATLREAWQGVPDAHANVSSLGEREASHTLNIRT